MQTIFCTQTLFPNFQVYLAHLNVSSVYNLGTLKHFCKVTLEMWNIKEKSRISG